MIGIRGRNYTPAPNKRLESLARAHSVTQFAMQVAFSYAKLSQIPQQIMRRSGERYMSGENFG